jgi:hypothetical protein
VQRTEGPHHVAVPLPQLACRVHDPEGVPSHSGSAPRSFHAALVDGPASRTDGLPRSVSAPTSKPTVLHQADSTGVIELVDACRDALLIFNWTM